MSDLGTIPISRPVIPSIGAGTDLQKRPVLGDRLHRLSNGLELRPGQAAGEMFLYALRWTGAASLRRPSPSSVSTAK